MKKTALPCGQENTNHKLILAKSCMLVDVAQAFWHLDLLGKNEKTARIRAFPCKGYKGTAIKAKTGFFGEHLPVAAEWNVSRGIYLVINSGFDNDASIKSCRACFVEWDDIPKQDQLDRWNQLKLPQPTFQVDTGGKSVHSYWVFRNPINPEIWKPLQKRLTSYCKADSSNINPSRVMRLAGFWYIDSTGRPREKVEVINATNFRYALADLENVVPANKRKISRPIKKSFSSNYRLKDIGEALSCIPPRKSGHNTYEDYRAIAWGLKAALKDIGKGEDLAIRLMETHSPSRDSGWDVRQVIRSGGDSIGAGTFFYYAKKHGWKS